MERTFSGAAAVILLLLHVAAVVAVLPAALDHDEAEYLHASWLMSHGKRIYRDFMEDHPPYLFQMLNVLQPKGGSAELPLLDVKAWTIRSRIAMVLCGTAAAMAVAAAVMRATRSAGGAVIAFACIAGSPWMWQRGIAQIRPDAPTLMLFWVGVLLLLLREEDGRAAAICSGFGMALVAAAEIWNPKWPLCGLVAGFFFLWRLVRNRRYAVLMIVPSAVVAVLMVLLTQRVTTLRDYFAFNFVLKSANMARFKTAPWVIATFASVEPFWFVAPYAKPIVVALLLIAAVVLLRRAARRSSADFRYAPAIVLLALMVAAAIEVRFVYTYPFLWQQYYLMWAFAAAALTGVTFGLVREEIPSRVLACSLGVVVALVIGVPGLRASRLTNESFNRSRWESMSYMQRTLAPGQTVWLSATLHPIAAFDASYFWYSPQDLIPDTLAEIRENERSRSYLPHIEERDLPPCGAAAGFPSTLRYTFGPGSVTMLPQASACLAILASRGQLRPTPFPPIHEVVRATQ